MRSIQNLTLALLLSAVTFGSQQYDHYLNGSAPLTEQALNSIYQNYMTDFKDSDIEQYLNNSNLTIAGRRSVFNANVQDIIAHNSQVSTWKKGINAFTAMTEQEFAQYYHIVSKDQICTVAPPSSGKTLADVRSALPARWDWRDFGIVTPVKNQGKCGSCWSFSTVGVMESHFMMKYGQFRNMSEQQLVDCAGGFDTYGCAGGLPSHSYEYIMYNQGLSAEVNYPYMGVNQTCQYKNGMQSMNVVGGSVNVSLSEVDEQIAVFENGPISVSFTVVDGFKAYKSGVYINPTCPNGPLDVNHDVVAIGYGTENLVDYWIIKNSWGASWGDNGFFKIQRGVNMCGIVNCGSYPQDVVDVATATPIV